jgi:hypothetical protein
VIRRIQHEPWRSPVTAFRLFERDSIIKGMERKRRLKLLNLFDELDCTADYYVVWWRKP